jgi:hypothetical protein
VIWTHRELKSSALLTTIGIPLYRSEKWLPNIVKNIAELSSSAHILISDATEEDHSLATLKQHFQGEENVEFVGQRTLTPGWAPHCNDLKKRAATPFFMWLPHDDWVQSDWITRGQEALQADPSAVLAVGSLQLVSEFKGPVKVLFPSPDNELADPVDRVTRALRRQFISGEPGLGHAFRGIQRGASTPFLPEHTPRPLALEDGWKADVFWAIQALTMGTFATFPAVYRKRIHDTSTSAPWENENTVTGFRSALVGYLGELSPTDRLSVITAVWDEEGTTHRQRNRETLTKLETLHTRISALRANIANRT